MRDLVRAELARLRPGGTGPDPGTGAGGDPEPGPADSLELLALATQVSRQFHLHETGLDDLLLARRSPADWAATVVRSRAAWDDAVTFSTSGSTGEPRHCTHRIADLEAELRFLQALFAGRRRILRVQPAHHIYGFLFSFMLPAALGVPVIDARSWGPGALLRRAQPGDLVVAHPHILELAASLPVRAAGDVTVVTSTAPCATTVWDRLAEAGVAEVVEIYGSSETAGIGWRRAPDGPFALMPQWSRAEGSGNAILRQGGDGRALPVPDSIAWTGEREFRVGGRIDGAVQVGGVNVYPERVRRLLLGHPAVADAAVRPMRPDEGRRLKAFVVPREPAAATAALAEEIMGWLEARSSPPEVPRSVRFGPALPRSEAGKPADWSAGVADGPR